MLVTRWFDRRGPTSSSLLLVTVLLLAAATSPPTSRADTGAARAGAVVEQEPGDRIVVLWQPAATPDVRAEVLGRLGVAPAADSPGPSLDVLVPGRGQLERVRSTLADHPAVRAVDIDQVVRLAPVELEEPDTEDAPTDEDPGLAPPPNDPLFPQQWALENTGQLASATSTARPDIGARTAWATTQGEPQVTVALIDSGIDLDHPDLAGAIWVNPGERVDGTDTNGNGFVDDVNGWDAVRRTPIIAADPSSWVPELHGTQVAGVLAARGDDGFGIIGVAPQVRLLPVRAFSEANSAEPGAGRSDIATLAAAITYAVDNGADLINASWESGTESAVLESVLADAGVPVVAAAGNRGLDLDVGGTVIPAGYDLDNLVAVTAIDPDGQVPRFATTGASTIDLAAPGVSIVATLPGGGHSTLGSGSASGTSFAVPFVTGTLALGRSVAPEASISDLLDALLRTTAVEPTLVGRTGTGGRLDAGAFLGALSRPACGDHAWKPAGFPDVPLDNVHASAIDCLVGRGIVRGDLDGRFVPADTVTRGQVATLVAGLIAVTSVLPSGAPDAFPDDDGSVHEPAMDALAALGILAGDDAGRGRPDDPVTRGQLASILVRTHGLLTDAQPAGTRRWFRDTSGSVHADALDVARELGVLRGTSRAVAEPAAGSRRDQVASTVARTLDAVARAGVGPDAPVPLGPGS